MGKNQNITKVNLKNFYKQFIHLNSKLLNFIKTSEDYKKVNLELRLESQFISNQITNKHTIQNTYLKYLFFNVHH